MMAAIWAARSGAEVTLIEKNDKPGKKLFLTGKGRCNLTNSCETEELFDNVVKNKKFMYSAFYSFDNNAVMEFFKSLGLNLKTERGGRVFPASDHSSDVIKYLKYELNKHNVSMLFNTEFTDFEEEDGKITSVILRDSSGKSKKIFTQRLIMATGGASYKSTGSDGSFAEVLKKHNIKPEPFCASLIPLVCEDKHITALCGISLKNVALTVKSGKKEKYSGFGEMLFAHFGITGPLVLSASAYLSDEDFKTGVICSIDLKPALSEEELDKRILRDFEANENKQLGNIIPGLVPARMTDVILYKAGICGQKKVNSITKDERRALIGALKKFDFELKGKRDINEAIITRGGVNVKEINPATMESKRIKGLYFAGEMIDVDALTGGYNLQIAWSTGYLAGISAAENE